MKVFASGSCRLLTGIGLTSEVVSIHSMTRNFVGVNFLGKLYNTKQHIQFLRWLKDEIELPEPILSCFLTSYSNREDIDDKALLIEKRQRIKDEFNSCDCFLFEICSIKVCERDGYQVQYELTDNWTLRTQTREELYGDLQIIRSIVPQEKLVVFQTHFRPNIIRNNVLLKISKRELIYFTVLAFCNAHSNTRIYDPSILIREDKSLYDGDVHFTERGHLRNFNYLLNNTISKWIISTNSKTVH